MANKNVSKNFPGTLKRINGMKGKESKKFRNKDVKNEKTEPKEKENFNSQGKENQGGKPVFTPFVVFGGALILTGITRISIDNRRVERIPRMSYKEFEMNYLLRGEVRVVNMLGKITSMKTGCVAEVFLYPNEDRPYQSISIEKSPDEDRIFSMIRKKESELHINRKEAVIFDVSSPELYIIIGFVMLCSRFLRKSVKDFRSASSFQKTYKVEDLFKFEIKAMKTKEPPIDMKRKGPFTVDQNGTKNEKPPKNAFDIFSQLLVDTTMEQFDKKSDIKFKDVAGLHSAKLEVKEFLDYLNNPSKFIRLGARLPRGAMLLGPPGCGKTLLVKALANESNVPFYYKAGSEFVDMIGGVGAKRMRQLFASARNNAPAIIFIDEIDAIGKKRSSQGDQGIDADQTLNQLLVEMDGMDSNVGVVVFAATNRADVLDTALIRPGRLDRHILIDLPVLEERKEIFNLYLNKYKSKLESGVADLKLKLALQTPGMSGADISNLCNEAALTAAKLDYTTIKNECFDIALERILAGAAKKNNFLSESERKIVAYHEAGHALVGWILKYADPILKVSIVPRTSAALGFTQLNLKERYLLTTDVLIDKITVLLGGRAAESIIFNRVTSGAHDDLRQVKKIAFSMIREWGMSEKVGHLSFRITEEEEAYGVLPFSKYTQALIEAEASSIVTSAYKRAEALLKEHVSKLELLAQELLKREVLVDSDIEVLIGPRPNAH